jgi:GT2 family glycosyltransferase
MISIIIVVYKSKKRLLNKFIKKLNSDHKLIIINNSDNYNFTKIYLPKNTTIIKTTNNGYGAALNEGLQKCNTKYAIISNIDISFEKKFIDKFYSLAKKINNFSILIPNHQKNKMKKNLIEVYGGEAAVMLVDVKKINNLKFDENYFLYYEETDLFFRCKINNYKVFKISNLRIAHKRSTSISSKKNNLIFLMKWHYMWSMFYYYKKNFGFYYAISKTYILILKDVVKIFYYLILIDKFNFKLRLYRLHGILTSICGIRSYKRP